MTSEREKFQLPIPKSRLRVLPPQERNRVLCRTNLAFRTTNTRKGCRFGSFWLVVLLRADTTARLFLPHGQNLIFAKCDNSSHMLLTDRASKALVVNVLCIECTMMLSKTCLPLCAEDLPVLLLSERSGCNTRIHTSAPLKLARTDKKAKKAKTRKSKDKESGYTDFLSFSPKPRSDSPPDCSDFFELGNGGGD